MIIVKPLRSEALDFYDDYFDIKCVIEGVDRLAVSDQVGEDHLASLIDS